VLAALGHTLFHAALHTGAAGTVAPESAEKDPAKRQNSKRSPESELTAPFEHQLLYPPIQQFGDVELGLRRAGDFVDPAELLELFA
jgi:hypothetical protein